MPYLPILTPDGKLKPEAVPITLAVMSTPENPEVADDAPVLVNAYAKKALEKFGPEHKPDLQGSLLMKPIREALEGAAAGGVCAGKTLERFVSLALDRPDQKSLNKALHLVHSEMRNVRLADGTRFTTSLRSIQRYWADYKSVAHLWAALRIWKASSTDNPMVFFSAAGIYQHFAEKHGLSLGPDPWRAPPGFKGPDLSIVFPPLSEENLQALAEYKAPPHR